MINNFMRKIRNKIISLFACKTIGARALVIKDGNILLVKHSYIPQWYSIGGGVEKGETPIEAVKRELLEEVGITCLNHPKLFNVYLNNREKRDDYVVLYIVEEFTQKTVSSPEIIAAEWFEISNLPQDISPATKRRIEEFLGSREALEKW